MLDMDMALAAFKEEAEELLVDLEEALLELEDDPHNSDTVARTFRDLHTIKGSGDMFGFKAVARFTHEVETIFDQVRSGDMELTSELLTLTLLAKDHITDMIAKGQDVENLSESDEELIERFKALASGEGGERPVPEASDELEVQPEEGRPPVEELPPGSRMLWISYRPTEALNDDLAAWLVDELGKLGAARVVRVVPPEGHRHDFLLNTDKGLESVLDVFLMVPDSETAIINDLGPERVRASDMDPLMDFLEGNSEESDEETVAHLTEIYAMIVEKVMALREAARVEREAKAAQVEHPKMQPASTIRVDAERLDKLINMVGELVIIQSRMSQASQIRKDPVLDQISEDLERLTDTMRDDALSIRMMPIGTAFSTFRRLVRDLSAKLEKSVTLQTEGAETELDKTIIDKLKDPILHILRNSLDHGLESPQERVASGKSEQGSIVLSASHLSGEVVITVQDDGRGIDRDKVVAKAVQNGLIASGDEMSDSEVFDLLFQPGFSTAKAVTNVSGRGVGMDVVRKSIDSLRGKVEMASEPGVGTTVIIRLPLTLAILDGLMVTIGEESYILPLATVQACQERFVDEDVKELETVERMGKMIPCVSLRKMLEVPGNQPEYERIIIAGVGGLDVGLAVDSVVGRQQAVIKSLSDTYQTMDWISGTTINGDGGISLILDVQRIVNFAAQESDLAA